MFERALALDKNYPAALNDLGYAYARNREFAEAFAAMERYVAVLPKEPNPHDSYAELLRMAGRFDAALEHYRAALKIDPDFVSSQLGLGDTYALMGDEVQARSEYGKAIQAAHTDADRLDYGLQKAMSWARENNFAEADKAFSAVAERAHAQGLDLEEAQAHRMMGIYQSEDAAALKHLEAAEDALSHQASLAQSDREEERSRILRYRAVRAVHAGNQELADKTLHQLETIASASRSNVIQTSYQGAAGALLMAKQRFADGYSSPGRRPRQPLFHGIAIPCLRGDRGQRQDARSRSPAERDQCPEHGGGTGGTRGSGQAAGIPVRRWFDG
jgi:Tfp pilus assembly protein PilF